MIRVVIKNNTVSVSGHANYADYGKDIVCASVSSVIGTVVNCIMNIDFDSISYLDNGEKITITKLKSIDTVDIILDTMVAMFRDLETKYKKNIKIESEE